jgi:hypothetical protein
LAPLHDDPNFPKCVSDLQHDKHEPLRAALISVQYCWHCKVHLRSVPYPLTLKSNSMKSGFRVYDKA